MICLEITEMLFSCHKFSTRAWGYGSVLRVFAFHAQSPGFNQQHTLCVMCVPIIPHGTNARDLKNIMGSVF